MTIPRVLIIAGSDSGGGAGIQADIKTVTMLGGHAMTAITAITAQNTLGVEAVMPVPTEMVLKQIDLVLADLGADAVKIGMIGSAETAAAVAQRLESIADLPVVFDPVMIATSGSVLADEATIAGFERLMRLSALATPNLPELAVLIDRALPGEEEIVDAAADLHQRFGCAILAKGGHAEGEQVTDILISQRGTTRYFSDRVDTRHTHGTGCTLASAIATGIGAGLELEQAVDRAVNYVQATLLAAPGFGRGSGPVGHGLGAIPFHHLKAAEDPALGVEAWDSLWAPKRTKH